MPVNTKPWNTHPDDLQTNEVPVTDYIDSSRDQPCSMKFKTKPDRLNPWIAAHKQVYPTAKWELQTEDTHTMRTGSNNKTSGSIVVKFHTTSCVVLVQGKHFNNWYGNFNHMLGLVDHWIDHPEDMPKDTAPSDHDELDNSRVFEADQKHTDSLSFDTEEDLMRSMSEEITNQEKIGESTPKSPKSKSTPKSCPPHPDNNDPAHIDLESRLYSIQEGYMRLVDDTNKAVQSLSCDIELFKSDLKKVPTNIHALLKPQLELLRKDGEEKQKLIDSQYQNNKRLCDENTSLLMQLKDEKLIRSQIQQKYTGLVLEFEDFKREAMKTKCNCNGTKKSSFFSFNRLLNKGPVKASAAQNITFTAPTPKKPFTQSGTQSFTLGATDGDADKHTIGQAMDDLTTPDRASLAPMEDIDNTELPTSPESSHASNITPHQIAHKSPESEATSELNSTTAPSDKTGATSETVPRPPGVAVVREQKRGHTDVEPESSGSEEEDDRSDPGEYTTQPGPRSAQFNPRRNAESVLLKDSTGRCIDIGKYMGQIPAYSTTTSTSSHALKLISTWEKSEKVRYAVAHTGVNDVTDGTGSHTVIRNLKSLLSKMHDKFPNAVVAFSEILYIGRGDRDSNDNQAVKFINDSMYTFCTENDYAYVTHTSLQDTGCRLFEDEKHLDSKGGTAVFVSDILNATGYRKSRAVQNQRRTTKSIGRPEMTIYNRNVNHGSHSSQYNRQSKRGDNADVTSFGGNHIDNLDSDQLIKLICLNMLRNK